MSREERNLANEQVLSLEFGQSVLAQFSGLVIHDQVLH